MKEKNYYELLEIDKNASKEIIDKAYKTLVKKYHPDVQNNMSDDIIKKINEAYEIISSPDKRNTYDISLSKNEISIEEYNKVVAENEILQNQNTELANRLESAINQNNIPKSVFESTTEPQQRIQQKPHATSIYKNNNYYAPEPRQYYSNLRNYTNKYNFQDTSVFKNLLSLIITLSLLLLISFILWNIPFTKQYLVSLYDSNIAIKSIVNIFIK